MAANANSAKVVAWQKANPEAYDAKMFAWRLKNKYGITVEQYNEMFNEQEGRCAICPATPDKRRLAVDHCHTTGKVRGLLCHSCNNHLGIFERRHADFTAYLEKHND